MSAELIQLKSNQHTVTFVPKISTDLPFFNLTYNKQNTPTEIKFEGKDEAGNPILWEVFHNTSKQIGYAGVQAHEIWYLLIKPAIDASRLSDGNIPQIIQLGGIRECLRMIGWTAGGHEARELIKVLSQIAFAGCVADLWFPTGETDNEGKEKFVQVKGRFSRLSVYSIGEQHLTQEELEKAEFKFELEDTLYIELNPLEIKLQQLQSNQQKLIDNEYMFSVKPSGRRWYELLVGKIFGAVKYKSEYFDIKYSWYVKHHHNLKKYNTRKRVVQQMNRVVKDHLEIGFLKAVEYKKIKESGKEIDFLIRYYVGPAAEDSINRIKGYLLNRERKKKQIPPNVNKANITPKFIEENQKQLLIPKQEEKADSNAQIASQRKLESRENIEFLNMVSHNSRELLKTLIIDYQISAKKAYILVTEKKEECQKQVEAFPYREMEIKNKAGYLIKAIENFYNLPEHFLEQKEKQIEKQKHQAKRNAIESCDFCNTEGYRFVKSKNYPTGAFKTCSHNENIESKLEEYKR